MGEPDVQRGYTALIHASEKDFEDCARLLMDAGADREAKSEVRLVASLLNLCADMVMYSYFYLCAFLYYLC